MGLFYHLVPPVHHLDVVRGNVIDDRLLKFFAKDFKRQSWIGSERYRG
jgi:hypothetical protein